ncbi:uncharacterized protein [Amphiura filiformis]|uniref:uncharacterized protein n=1 Tax=Amphiura filiformis TaxID=82378 RepID=UPI003B2211C5
MESNEYHEKALASLCRICGQRCVRWPASQKKNGTEKYKHSSAIHNTFNININNDIPALHPQFLCLSCVAALGKPTRRPVIGWSEHDSNCTACRMMQESTRKRRLKPAKVAARRRREREDDERQAKAIEAACDILLEATSSSTHTPNKKLQRLATNVVKDLMDDDDIVELPTGGPKYVLKKVVKPRIPSHQASARTVRSRTHGLQQHINMISSNKKDDEEAAIHQLAALLKGKSTAELKELLHSEGLLKIRIPAGHELKLKAQMGWTWNEMRKLKSWLKAYKVQMVCEGQSRQMKADLVGDCVSSDLVPFLFKEKDEHVTKLAPIVFIPNLEDHIMKTLDELERLDHLVWDGIPAEQIWIKIGGDKGGGTTKFYYQIVNVSKNNSKFNTTAFCVYAADETVANMHTALDQYVTQISNLQHSEWRGKKIVLWLSGDYEILRKLLGLQGAAATCPCILCLQDKHNLASKQPAQQRTLEMIKNDFDTVESNNYTSQSKRENHSVSHRPFFDIPLDKVRTCLPPSLHISLGLWGKFYQNLERDITELGELIADIEPSCSSSAAFDKHIKHKQSVLKEIHRLEEKSEEKYQEATELESTN